MATVVTNGSISNATGDPLTFVRPPHDWEGVSQGPYPPEIDNADTAEFTHSSRPGVAEGSKGAVVYDVKNADKENESDWMFAWVNPSKGGQSTTHAYTEIRQPGYFTKDIWPRINETLETARSESEDTQRGCSAKVTINEGVLTATINLKN